MEHPRLPEFTTLGKVTFDVDEYYLEKEENDNQPILKALVEQENEELMGKWDGDEYMNGVNWPEKNLRKDTNMKIFPYPDEVEENRFMWCCEVVERVKTRYYKVIKVYIKRNENIIACGERHAKTKIELAAFLRGCDFSPLP